MKYIITSALPYAEGMPHLGNLVGSILPADIYFKFMKMCGEDAIFICGSDQHGTPIELQAIKKGTTPKELADTMHNKIKEALEKFECTFTYYGKTDTEENKETVYDIFNALYNNNYIKEVKSELPYCNVDKRFLTDRLIEGTCPYCGYEHARGDQCENCGRLLTPRELIKPYCTICGKSDIVFKETTNLAFDMKALENEIRAFIEKNSKHNWSKNAINHSLNYISRGLEAREITRDLKWGFPVPLKGFEDKVFYVWFDAVIGYIGITKEWNNEKWKDYWLGKSRLIQFMGKDNIEFHTLMWPGILIGSKKGFALPYTIYAYEYLLAHGLKFSKSKGIGLNIENALEILPADYWRFILAELLPEGADVELSIERIVEIVNNDLNNLLGNFIHRSLVLAVSNFGNEVPLLNEDLLGREEKKTIKEIENKVKEYFKNFKSIKIREALKNILEIASIGNSFISNTEPWALAKKDDEKTKQKLGNIVYILLDTVFKLGNMLYPFVPETSSKILAFFNESSPHASCLESNLRSGSKLNINKPQPLFKKIGEEEIEKFKKYGG
ncbi:MAG: methionine--tRNA ligase [Candidatus Micrarchaeota archaeon]